MGAIGINDDPELFHGLTISGTLGAQIRNHGLVIDIARLMPQESPSVLGIDQDDARRLRDLLNVATARGFL